MNLGKLVFSCLITFGLLLFTFCRLHSSIESKFPISQSFPLRENTFVLRAFQCHFKNQKQFHNLLHILFSCNFRFINFSPNFLKGNTLTRFSLCLTTFNLTLYYVFTVYSCKFGEIHKSCLVRIG